MANKKDEGIEISPKYGVNPMMPICFFCGEPTNEIALLGRIRERGPNGKPIKDSDLEAPKSMVLDYRPCKKCEELMAQGITLIGVSETAPDKRPPICTNNGKDIYPTGLWVVATEKAIPLIFNQEIVDDILARRVCFVPNSLVEHLKTEYEKGAQSNEESDN